MGTAELIQAWRAQPEASREAVLGEIRNLATGWSQSASDEETRQDAATLRIALDLLQLLNLETWGTTDVGRERT